MGALSFALASFQLANILAALLVAREAAPTLWRVVTQRPHERTHTDLSPVLLSIGALGMAVTVGLTLWFRLIVGKLADHGPLLDLTPPTSLAASIAAYCVLWWFHHLLRRTKPVLDAGDWSYQHRLMVGILTTAVAVAAVAS